MWFVNLLKWIGRNFVRMLINTVFLTSSCFFSVNFIIVLFQNAIFDKVVAVFAIFIEIYFQYSLYLAERRKQEGKFWAARALKAQYIVIYVLIYCHLSGLGFFLTEVRSTNVVLRRQEFVEMATMDRIKQIDQELTTLNAHLTKEAESGFGRRSENIIKKMDELKKERETLVERFDETSGTSQVQDAATVKNSFQGLAEAFGVSENVLQLIVFETIMAIIYIGLYVTRWQPESEAERMGNQEAGKSFGVREKFWNKIFKKHRTKTCQSSPETSNKKFQSFPESSKSFLETSPETLTSKVSGFPKTSPESLPKIQAVPKPQSEWERFVRASIRDSGSLNSVKRVSMLTGIPLDRCLDYRKRLEAMTIGGEPVVETTQGVSRAKFEKEVILERVRGAI